MVIPANGAVVLVRFPFSDLSNTKVRPAIVLAETGRDIESKDVDRGVGNLPRIEHGRECGVVLLRPRVVLIMGRG